MNSDSNSKYSAKSGGGNGKGSQHNNNNNPPLSSSEKKSANANGANNNNNSSVNSNRNVSNNPNSSSNNLSQATNSSNNINNASGHLRQRHIIELNRQVSELNNKNIEFNRQLSAPVENQNSCNSVYNLYSNQILQNSNNQYHSGSPNTNSLNRTKKKRSLKLNGR